MAEQQASFLVQMRDGVTASARRMRASIKSLRGSIKELQSTAAQSRLGRSFGGMGKSISDMHGRWEKFQKSAAFGKIEAGVGKIKEGLLLTAAIGAGAAAAIGSMIVKFADFAQVSSLGFKAVAKHGASSEKLFAHSRQLAEDLGLDVMDTTKNMVKLLALQFDPKMATDLIKMGADLRALGADTEGVNRVFSQLGQIQAKGKLQGEELIVLAENGISTQLVYEQLGKTLGKTKDEILKMQQAGKLTSDMAFPAIMAAVMQKTGSKELGMVGKQIADQTLGGMAGRMKAQFQNMMIDVARDATPAIMGAFKPIGDEISALMKNKDFREGIVVAFENLGSFIKQAIPFVKEFVGGLVSGFKEAWPAIKGALGVLFQGFGGKQDWLETAKDFGRVLGIITAGAVGLAGVLSGLLAAGIELATGMFSRQVSAVQNVINAIGRFVFTITDTFANVSAIFDSTKMTWFEKMKEIGKFILQGLADGIKAAAMIPITAVQGMGEQVIGTLRTILRIKSPSEVTTSMGEMLGAGLEQGFIRSMRAANDNMGRAASSAVPAIEGPLAASVTSAGAGHEQGFPGGGGPQHVSFTFKVTINQQPGQSAEDVADELERFAKRMVDQRLEELAIEAA